MRIFQLKTHVACLFLGLVMMSSYAQVLPPSASNFFNHDLKTIYNLLKNGSANNGESVGGVQDDNLPPYRSYPEAASYCRSSQRSSLPSLVFDQYNYTNMSLFAVHLFEEGLIFLDTDVVRLHYGGPIARLCEKAQLSGKRRYVICENQIADLSSRMKSLDELKGIISENEASMLTDYVDVKQYLGTISTISIFLVFSCLVLLALSTVKKSTLSHSDSTALGPRGFSLPLYVGYILLGLACIAATSDTHFAKTHLTNIAGFATFCSLFSKIVTYFYLNHHNFELKKRAKALSHPGDEAGILTFPSLVDAKAKPLRYVRKCVAIAILLAACITGLCFSFKFFVSDRDWLPSAHSSEVIDPWIYRDPNATTPVFQPFYGYSYYVFSSVTPVLLISILLLASSLYLCFDFSKIKESETMNKRFVGYLNYFQLMDDTITFAYCVALYFCSFKPSLMNWMAAQILSDLIFGSVFVVLAGLRYL